MDFDIFVLFNFIILFFVVLTFRNRGNNKLIYKPFYCYYYYEMSLFLETFIYKRTLLVFMTEKKLRELKEIEEETKEPEFDYIEKFATISDDTKSLLLRIPQEITKHFKIEKGQKIKFRAEFRKDKIPKLEIKLIQNVR